MVGYFYREQKRNWKLGDSNMRFWVVREVCLRFVFLFLDWSSLVRFCEKNCFLFGLCMVFSFGFVLSVFNNHFLFLVLKTKERQLNKKNKKDFFQKTSIKNNLVCFQSITRHISE